MSLSPSGGVPLTVLAGMPDKLAPQVKEQIEKRFLRFDGQPLREFVILSGGKSAACYTDHVVKKTIENLSDRVKSKRVKSAKECQYSPGHLSLVYLMGEETAGYHSLFSYFFLCCRCVGVSNKEKPWPDYSVSDFVDIYEKAIHSMDKWESERASAAFYLPVRNFCITKDVTLKEKYFERIKQNQPPYLKDEIQIKNCKDKSKCPACKCTKQRVPLDDRGLCFIQGARHGTFKDFSESNSRVKKERQAQFILESLYRFGQPVEPGTQSDVQFEGGATLKNIQFECAPLDIKVSRDTIYANIYINDFVRYPS